MKLELALANITRLYLDTAPVIDLVERNPQFFDRVRSIFQKVDEEQLTVLLHPLPWQSARWVLTADRKCK